jgi:hypothetical protein
MNKPEIREFICSCSAIFQIDPERIANSLYFCTKPRNKGINMGKETFSDYDITKAMAFLNLSHPLKWDIPLNAVTPSDFLTVGLREAERQVIIGSNEWEQRLFMELIFLEALRGRNLKMWQEKQIDGGESPFRGKVDFAFTPYHIAFKSPYLILSEAKKEDFEQGWGQCLMAMKACQMMNEKEEHKFDVYGIVSTGMFWEFGKYTTDHQFYKTGGYTLTQPDIILGILDYLFTECERRI